MNKLFRKLEFKSNVVSKSESNFDQFRNKIRLLNHDFQFFRDYLDILLNLIKLIFENSQLKRLIYIYIYIVYILYIHNQKEGERKVLADGLKSLKNIKNKYFFSRFTQLSYEFIQLSVNRKIPKIRVLKL